MKYTISEEELRAKLNAYARESDSRLSLILGAGASRGYSRDEFYTWRPPTVSELLSDDNPIVKHVINKEEHRAVKGQRGHIERSVKSFGGDLEAYLSDLYRNDKDDARFPALVRYLEDVFTLASMHVDLDDNYLQSMLSRIRDLRGSRPWTILTFNYDTILEQSIANLPIFVPARIFQNDHNYLAQNPKVLKMHGGVNLRYLSALDPLASGYPTAHEIFTAMMSNSGPIENYLDTTHIGSDVPGSVGHRTFEKIGGRSVYNFPLMMIPMHALTKSENSFFGRQIEQGKAEIAQSELVVAIGYQFGDNHFLDALKGVNLEKSKLVLVGSDRLRQEGAESRAFKQASMVWPKENIRIFDGNGLGSFADALY